MIKVYINEQEICTNATTTLTQALAAHKVEAIQCAIAINQHIIPRIQWETTYLQDGDKILIIKAVQGG